MLLVEGKLVKQVLHNLSVKKLKYLCTTSISGPAQPNVPRSGSGRCQFPSSFELRVTSIRSNLNSSLTAKQSYSQKKDKYLPSPACFLYSIMFCIFSLPTLMVAFMFQGLARQQGRNNSVAHSEEA